jgi:predicted dehydrogenase
MAGKKIKVGIIGAGTIGNIHAEALAATGQAELVALCDIDAVKLAAQGERHKAKACFADYREVIASEAEAVFVCVPNALHKEMAIAALEAGKHVFLEKPSALNAAETAEIAAAADKAKGVLQMGMVWRESPEAELIREYVQAGRFGQVYQMRTVLLRRRGIPGMGGWFTTKAMSGGGPMIDLGVHWFDLSMWMSGLWQPTSVSAKVYAKFGAKMRDYRYVEMWAGPPNFDGVCDVEDYSTGFVRFGDQATLSFEIAWACNAESESYIEVLGDKAGGRMDFGKPLQILTEDQDHLVNLTPQYRARRNRYESEDRKFLAACRGEGPVPATIQQGLTVMKLIDAVYASSEQNGEIAIA